MVVLNPSETTSSLAPSRRRQVAVRRERQRRQLSASLFGEEKLRGVARNGWWMGVAWDQ